MDVNLLLNSAENEPSISPTSTTSSSNEISPTISAPSTAEPGQVSATITPYIPYQTHNLRHGPCTIHPHSPPRRNPFSPEEDAVMQYMIDELQFSRVAIIALCLKRGGHAINTRWNVLEDYEPCSRCIQCQRYLNKLEELRRKYVYSPRNGLLCITIYSLFV